MSLCQEAPYPDALADLVSVVTYRSGWTFELVDDLARDQVDGVTVGHGMTLVIATLGKNSYHPERGDTYRVHHYFIVPAATYDRKSWQRWLFDQVLSVEQHETMEFFVVGGARPYAPNHGPGRNPYVVHEYSTDEARRTRFTGEVLSS